MPTAGQGVPEREGTTGNLLPTRTARSTGRTAVAIEITRRPETEEEPTGLVIVEDLEALAEESAAPCNDDNPYR
ncbi:hypothetical protein [Streptomyces sp. NPDC002845]